MNRKIKFRAWDSKNRVLLFSDTLWVRLDGKRLLVEWDLGQNSCVDLSDKQYTLQQFIGIEDVNGKDIYEGDIIKTQIYDGWDAVPCGYCNYEVKWSLVELAWRGYTNKMNGLYSGVNIFKDVLIEVVGNIFENPELLDNGKKFIKDVHKKIGWES
jgi:uncharacterized phage protein (TIGR01671 family)